MASSNRAARPIKYLSTAVMLTAVLSLAACTTDSGAPVTDGKRMPVSAEVLNYFKTDYLQTIGSTYPGAFAVSISGHNAAFSYCPATHCKSGWSYGAKAIGNCESHGEKCYVFAYGTSIKVDYDVVP